MCIGLVTVFPKLSPLITLTLVKGFALKRDFSEVKNVWNKRPFEQFDCPTSGYFKMAVRRHLIRMFASLSMKTQSYKAIRMDKAFSQNTFLRLWLLILGVAWCWWHSRVYRRAGIGLHGTPFINTWIPFGAYHHHNLKREQNHWPN